MALGDDNRPFFMRAGPAGGFLFLDSRPGSWRPTPHRRRPTGAGAGHQPWRRAPLLVPGSASRTAVRRSGARCRCVLPVAALDRSSSRRTWQEYRASRITFRGLSVGPGRVERGHAGNVRRFIRIPESAVTKLDVDTGHDAGTFHSSLPN